MPTVKPQETLRQRCVRAVVEAGRPISTVEISLRAQYDESLVRRCVTACVKDGVLDKVKIIRSPKGGQMLVVDTTRKGRRLLEVVGPQKRGVKPGTKRGPPDKGMGSGQCLLQDIWKWPT
jgi:hypothetical protein